MDFFATFWKWLSAELVNYIGNNTALVAATLEPAVVVLATIYISVWGYLQLLGRVDEPFITGFKRIATLAVVLGVALRLWLYNTLLVDTFYSAPVEFAAKIIGASDPVAIIDKIWDDGGAVANALWTRAHIFDSLVFGSSAILVWLLVGILCVYTMFLIALASIAQAVLLAVGPLFIVMLLFERTRRLFDAWISQLTNYALITVLTMMVAALLLNIVKNYGDQTAALGAAIKPVDALDLLLVSGLVLLVMRQVMPIASALASGVALNSFSIVSRLVSWPIRRVMP